MQLLDIERGIAAANIYNAALPGYVVHRGDFREAIASLRDAWESGRDDGLVVGATSVDIVDGNEPVQMQGELQIIGDTAVRQQIITKMLGKYIGMMNLVIQESKR